MSAPQHELSKPGAAPPWAQPGARPLVRIEGVAQALRRVRARSTALARHLRAASSSRCSGRRAAARPRCCACSPASRRRTRAASCSTARTSRGVPPHRAAGQHDVPELRAVSASQRSRDNIAFGLKQDGMPRAEIDARVAEMLALVKLEGLAQRKPHQLSGGQRQRVALARSLAQAAARFCCSTSRWPRSTRSCARRPSSS